jgi:nucleoside-diphosphate-sugar epimerase
VILITGFPGQDARILSVACWELGIKACALTHRPEEVTACSAQHTRGTRREQVHLFRSDESFGCEFKQFLLEREVRAIFHMAAVSDPTECERSPVKAYESNVRLTQEIIRAAMDARNDIRVAFASSVYVKSTEDCRDRRIEENTTESKSCGIYIRTKRACSELIGIYRKGGLDKCSQFFLGNHESPIRQERFIIPTLVKNIRDGGMMQEIRRPYVVRDWQDACISLAQMALALARSPGVDFVVGSGSSYSIADIANKLSDINGKPLLYERPYDDNERDIVRIDPTRIETTTGIQGCDESIWDMLRYMNENWGRVNGGTDSRWIRRSPGWGLLERALTELSRTIG